MNLKDVVYVGIFTEHINGTLNKDIPNQHITLAYRPDEEIFQELLKHLGEKCEISVLGYGNDGMNEGLEVEISEDIPYFGASQKHITLSIDKASSPVKTGLIDFDMPVPEHIAEQMPDEMFGKIAVFTTTRELIYDADLFNAEIELNEADSVLDNDGAMEDRHAEYTEEKTREKTKYYKNDDEKETKDCDDRELCR